MPLDYTIEAGYPGIVAGIDEAGRGPWAGPVVAAAVILDRNRFPSGINDSKKLSKGKREMLFDAIMAQAICGVGVCSPQEIDKHNILGATKLAMLRAYEAMSGRPYIALVDGNQLPNLPCAMEAIIDGDALRISIAAASIIAKVTRDRMMAELALEHPQYGWERNAGYGTREHQDALERFGVTPHHRQSFAPVRKRLQQVALVAM